MVNFDDREVLISKATLRRNDWEIQHRVNQIRMVVYSLWTLVFMGGRCVVLLDLRIFGLS